MEKELFEFLEEHKDEKLRVYSEQDPFLGGISLVLTYLPQKGPPLNTKRMLDYNEVMSPLFSMRSVLEEMFESIKKYEKGE